MMCTQIKSVFHHQGWVMVMVFSEKCTNSVSRYSYITHAILKECKTRKETEKNLERARKRLREKQPERGERQPWQISDEHFISTYSHTAPLFDVHLLGGSGYRTIPFRKITTARLGRVHLLNITATSSTQCLLQFLPGNQQGMVARRNSLLEKSTVRRVEGWVVEVGWEE